MKIHILFFLMVAMNLSSSGLLAQEPLIVFHPIDERNVDAKESYYSIRLTSLLKSWPPKIFLHSKNSTQESRPVIMLGIKTQGNETYIGLGKRFLIHAPIKSVTDLLDDFDHYKDRNPDLVEIKVKSQDGNRFSTQWEFKSPAFFIPNSRYEQIYIVDRKNPNKIVYRYQLKNGNNLNYSDGLTVVESQGTSTLVTGFDFFDARWGLLSSVALGKIWKESIEGYYKGDLALKLQAEHPDWKFEQIESERKKILEKFPVEPIQYLEKPLFNE